MAVYFTHSEGKHVQGHIILAYSDRVSTSDATGTQNLRRHPWHIINCYFSYMGVSENSVPHCTQWFCWSLSLWKMAISLGILTQHFQTNPYFSSCFPYRSPLNGAAMAYNPIWPTLVHVFIQRGYIGHWLVPGNDFVWSNSIKVPFTLSGSQIMLNLHHT